MKLSLVLGVVALCSIAAATKAATAAAPSLTLAVNQGHPGYVTTFTGSGFPANDAVDVYVDTTDTLLLIASSSGTLSGSITCPLTAQPGTHYVTAVARQNTNGAQAKFTVSTPWVQEGYGNAHQNSNPYENTLSNSNVQSLGPVFSTNVGALGGTPAAVGSRLFVGTETGVLALSNTTGKTIWSRTFGTNEQFFSSPAVISGVVYIGSSLGNLYALNATTGATVWTKAIGSQIYASPLVINGIIYIGGTDDAMYAVQASNGTVIWKTSTGDSIYSSAAYFNGVVLFGSNDDKVYALNATTGAVIWSYTTGAVVESSPAIVNGAVYIGSQDGSVYSLRVASGALVWSYDTGNPVYGSPAIANGLVYVGSTNSTFYALNAHTGTVYWSNTAGAGCSSSAAVANGVVYYTCGDDTLYAADAAYGSILATSAMGYTDYGSPAVSDGKVYLSTISDDEPGAVIAMAPKAGSDVVPHAAPTLASLHRDPTLRITPSDWRD